jgi:DNA repair exonuclease SbcCD ATPase subunit
MLSILQRQAKLLEKELKDKQKECLELQHTTTDMREQIKSKDIRIEILEAELLALKQQGQLQPNIDEEAAQVIDESHVVDLSGIISELIKKIEQCEGDLAIAELQTSVLKLQQATKVLVHIGAVRKLESALNEANEEINRLRKSDRLIDRTEMELVQIKEDLKRRDEEIEFLLHVHEASSGYDWTNHGSSGIPATSQVHLSSFAAGSASNAIAMISSRKNEEEDSLRFLVELGATTEAAREVLEATGGDVDRAALILFP